MNTKQIRFDDIHPAITQDHFDQFTTEIFDRKVLIVYGKRSCIVPFSSKSEAEGVLNFIKEFAVESLREITGYPFDRLPFSVTLCLSPEEELAKKERQERIRRLEEEKRRMEERQKRKREKRERRDLRLSLQQDVIELEAALEEMKIEEEIRQLEAKQRRREREMELSGECVELRARFEEEKNEIEELKVLMKEVKAREKLKDDIERLRIAAEAYDLDVEPPEWTVDRKWKEYEKVMIEWYTVSTITFGSKLIKTKEESGEMRMKAKPFAKGTFRLAYYAQVKRKGIVENMTAKAFIEPSPKGDDSILLANIETQLLAKQAAATFCAANKSTVVEFVEAVVVRVPGKYNYFVEPHLAGVWKRFTNNTGGVSELEKAPTALAFSHYSYQASAQHMIVVDIQGVRSPLGYLLTDPAVHCRDISKYGESNFGTKGFDNFFETHECNYVCKKLGLTRHAKQIKPDNTSPIPANM